jgi:hypothetical protein
VSPAEKDGAPARACPTLSTGLQQDQEVWEVISYRADCVAKNDRVGKPNQHVHTAGNPESLIGPVRAAIQSVDADIPVSEIRTMDQMVEE